MESLFQPLQRKASKRPRTSPKSPKKKAPEPEAKALNARQRRLLRRQQLREEPEAVTGEATGEAAVEGVPVVAVVEEAPVEGPAPEADAPEQNAKERRMAKRAAARSASEGLKEPAATPVAEGNAKERRMAKRAAARSAPVAPEAAKATAPALETEGNAKERRMAKRAAARATAAVSEARPVARMPTEAELAQMNAKDRRKAKRAAERTSSVSPGPATAAGNASRGGAPKGGQRNPCIVFVGQLTFRTTAKELDAHFASHGVEGIVKVRLLTDATTKRSRGMAFVELASPEALHECLKLHHTMLDGRNINVEKSAGRGGRNSGTRTARLKEKREEQQTMIDGMVERMLAERVAAKTLAAGEVDAKCIALLSRFEGRVVEKALDAYCMRGKPGDRGGVQNPSAMVTHLLRKAAENLPAFEKDVEEQKKIEAERKSKKRSAGPRDRPETRERPSRETAHRGDERDAKRARLAPAPAPAPAPEEAMAIDPSAEDAGLPRSSEGVDASAPSERPPLSSLEVAMAADAGTLKRGDRDESETPFAPGAATRHQGSSATAALSTASASPAPRRDLMELFPSLKSRVQCN